MQAFIQQLSQRHPEELFHAAFVSLLTRYQQGESGMMDWSSMAPYASTDIPSLDQLPESTTETGKQAMAKLAVLKLNGGLGTSMGCSGPKSLVPISEGRTFLDIILQQLDVARDTYQSSLPFVLMNSGFTHTQTSDYLKDIHHMSFLQPMFPRIDAQTGQPFVCERDPNQEWYPPGHGAVYMSLIQSGTLDQLLDQGIRYLFVSNSDNLGAQVDPALLGHLIEHDLDFLMEVTPKTHLDVKGGTVVKMKTGGLQLLERAQVPSEHLSDYEDTNTFSIFNTNSLWIRLEAVKKQLDALVNNLPLIVNPKQVDGRNVVQLETAMGAAISVFDRTGIVSVPRDRFIAVKHTSDLMLLQSDGIEEVSTGRFAYADTYKQNGYPSISLGPSFKALADYQKRVPDVPSLKHVRKLSIQKDMTIAPGTVFEGDVSL